MGKFLFVCGGWSRSVVAVRIIGALVRRNRGRGSWFTVLLRDESRSCRRRRGRYFVGSDSGWKGVYFGRDDVFSVVGLATCRRS